MDDPEALRTLIEDIFLRQQMWTLLWIFLVALLSAGGAFFGAYFKQRGENYATKQDFDNMRERLETNTRVTEEIKAKIGRRSDFEMQILLEKYNLLTDLQLRFDNLIVDLQRAKDGVDIPGLYKNGEMVPLTEIIVILITKRWLISERFRAILDREKEIVLKMVQHLENNKVENIRKQLFDERNQLTKEYGLAMNEEFNIDKISWIVTE